MSEFDPYDFGRASARAPSPSPHGPPGARADGRPPKISVIDREAFAPLVEEQRYGVYLVVGEDLRLLATSDKDGIGAALVAQDDDARDAGAPGLPTLGCVGIRDRIEGRWIIHPWHRGDRR